MKATPLLQGCIGLSFCLLSFGGMWGMISGATVKGKIAGANFSVNEKLQAVDQAYEDIEDVVQVINATPQIPQGKKQKIRRSLNEAEQVIENTEDAVSEDMVDYLEEEMAN